MYHHLLQQYFGYSELKPSQKMVVEHLLAGQDTVAVLPTGMGKSLIYQLVGLAQPGLTIVISPLLALMFDQVRQLQERHISAASWNCLTPPAMKQQILRRLRHQELKFLYLSPEKLHSPLVSAILRTTPINLMAIDEAHCVSQWAVDFRPSYGHIGRWVAWYGQQQKRPLLAAFTATTTTIGLTDIVQRLELQAPAVIAWPCFRDNLRYQIIPVPSENWKRQLLAHLLRTWEHQLDGIVIIYAATRLDVMWVATWLRSNGFPQTQYFHAGLDQAVKAELLSQLSQPGFRGILVATNAFGLGIDLPHVRLVIHHAPPASLAAFVQEAGRAGRDGQEAFSVVLWQKDAWFDNLEFFLRSDSAVWRQRKWAEARAMYQWLERRECLSRQIVRYFRLPTTLPCSLQGCGCQFCQPDFPWNPVRTRRRSKTKQRTLRPIDASSRLALDPSHEPCAQTSPSNHRPRSAPSSHHDRV